MSASHSSSGWTSAIGWGGSLTSTDRGSDAIGWTGNFGLDERELDVLFKFIDGDGSGRIDVEELR